jgi:hypothetical protein
MKKRTNIKIDENSFEDKYKEISDEEIVSILKYREHFQPKAFQAALKIAIERGLINSTEDLAREEFAPHKLPPRSIFPLGTSKAYTFAIFKSLCRIFYGIGLLPLVFGVFKIVGRDYYNGALSLLIAAILFFIANRLEKTLNPLFAKIILFINIPVAASAVFFLFSREQNSKMDTFAVAVIVMVLLYVSLYLYKLSKHLSKTSKK